MSDYRHLKVDVKDGIAVVTLDRADKRNAVNDALILDLERFFSSVPAGVKAAVLTGAGPHFSAGLDLAAAREELTCAACSFVLRNPVTVPSGQSFCQVCFDALKRTDQLGRFIIDDQSLKYTLQKQLGTNVALKGAAELLFKEACALPDEVRARRDLVQSRAAWP